MSTENTGTINWRDVAERAQVTYAEAFATMMSLPDCRDLGFRSTGPTTVASDRVSVSFGINGVSFCVLGDKRLVMEIHQTWTYGQVVDVAVALHRMERGEGWS